MPELHLRLQVDNLQLSAGEGVKTNIYAPQSENSIRGVSIPVAKDKYEKFELDPGAYLVECVLPSGLITTKDVLLKEGEVKRVSVEADTSPHEWLKWQNYAGNVTGRKSPDVFEKTGASQPINATLKRVRTSTTDALEASRTLINQSNSVYQDLMKEAEASPREGDLDDKLQMVDELMLTELFDASNNPDFNGAKLWDTIVGLIGPSSGERLGRLMAASRSSLSADADARQFDPIPATEADDKSQRYLITPRTKAEIRTLYFWSPAGAELLRVPHKWLNVYDNNPSPIDVLVDLQSTAQEFRSSVTVQDRGLISAMGYWSSGSVPTAGKYIRHAESMLFGKSANPYSAAMGGYILLRLGDIKPNDKWPEWIRNLSERFEWLPDGRILQGLLELNEKKPDDALKSLTQSFERGVPVFAMGIKLLLNGLRLFTAEDSKAKELHQIVQKVAWRTNMSQPFTAIRLGPSQ